MFSSTAAPAPPYKSRPVSFPVTGAWRLYLSSFRVDCLESSWLGMVCQIFRESRYLEQTLHWFACPFKFVLPKSLLSCPRSLVYDLNAILSFVAAFFLFRAFIEALFGRMKCVTAVSGSVRDPRVLMLSFGGPWATTINLVQSSEVFGCIEMLQAEGVSSSMRF
ncbi:hypothetical protein YC2023_044690 [Brassica napus]